MSPRKLISLIGSVLITGVFLLGLTNAGPGHATQPDTIDGLPVTNLPGMTVRPPAQATVENSMGNDTDMIMSFAEDGRSLIHELTVQVTDSHLRMPYYSFASASLQISKD